MFQHLCIKLKKKLKKRDPLEILQRFGCAIIRVCSRMFDSEQTR
jgi:hypothetical protein